MTGEVALETEQYVHEAYTELNPLTKLYYNRAFFRIADEYLKKIKPGTYSMVAIDMEHFYLFNKLYGRDEGDKLLIYIADCLRKVQDTYGGVAGYLGGDNFCILMPNRFDLVRELKYEIIKGVNRCSNMVGFLPAIGVYTINDTSVQAVVMHDRAMLALSHVVGNYAKRICQYDSGMEETLEEELKLLSEVQEALEKEEFTFYAQPQCDISTGRIVGAESLVRWKHSTKGLIPPGVFIPVLEKNGFIADLDRYVWKKVCEWLRSWIDRGHQPVPISINVSRIDIFSMDVPEYLMELIHNYDIPAKLLKVEITESAYAESNDKITNAVKQLRDEGFLVMMDDFGSGYSSLNMLKNVVVDVIKIDMRFLDINEQEEEKGIGILESVVNMARQMGLPIIVEGVETQKQESFLLKMGCRYTQGYYYYRPLPIDEFERILSDERNLDFDGLWCKQVEALHVREFLDNNLFSDTMVNNILGATAFYDMYENQIEIVRINEQYYQLAGISSSEQADYDKKLWNHVRDDDRQKLFYIFEQAYENQVGGAKGYVHYLRADGKVLWIYLRVFFLREKDGHKMFYGSLVDMTDLHDKKKEKGLSGQTVGELTEIQQNNMEKYFGDFPCGYGVGKIILDKSGNPSDYEIVYINNEMKRICGENTNRLRYLTLKAFSDNWTEMLKKAYQAAFLGETVNDYAYNSMSSHYLQLTFYQYEYGYAACIVRDITHMHIYEDALKSIMHSYREVYFIHLQDNYCRMIYPDDNHLLERGNYEELINRHFGTGRILKYDEEKVRKFLSLENLKSTLMTQDTMEYKYQRSVDGISDEWCLTSFIVSERVNGVPKTAIMTIRSIDTLIREEEERKRQCMAETLANMSDGFFIYRAADDEKILYANPPVLQMFGCNSIQEFRKLTGGSFHGMVHPEDVDRVECEIKDQITKSDRKMDFIQYRIIRKDGQIRWIDDCGHLEDSGVSIDSGLFYVFISDITDKITGKQQEKLIKMNEHYKKADVAEADVVKGVSDNVKGKLEELNRNEAKY